MYTALNSYHWSYSSGNKQASDQQSKKNKNHNRLAKGNIDTPVVELQLS